VKIAEAEKKFPLDSSGALIRKVIASVTSI